MDGTSQNPVFSLDKLMGETRRLAAEYYRTTRMALPVSNEIAKYDACRLLGLQLPAQPMAGVDAIDAQQCLIQIKSRVIFQQDKSGYRIGQVTPEGSWQRLLLVLLNVNYEPTEIYSVHRDDILRALQQHSANSKRTKRGAMSVAKFKMIGELVWSSTDGLIAAN